MTISVNEKVNFVRGILIFAASHGMLVSYDELRRLARLCDRQLGSYLGQVRTNLAPGEPDLCAVVVGVNGTPGVSWGNLANWSQELRRVFTFYGDRRTFDNTEFQARHGMLPTLPGLTA